MVKHTTRLRRKNETMVYLLDDADATAGLDSLNLLSGPVHHGSQRDAEVGTASRLACSCGKMVLFFLRRCRVLLFSTQNAPRAT